ncbi:MAG: hypothetical protein KF857_01365 [Fimbriimonadaceae bacterium]|nr:hypothetical protein [Fimbriimonadaceae bacterium]
MNDWQEQIHAYADGECDSAEKAQVEQRVAAEPAAANELLWAQALPDLVARRCHTEPCMETWKKAVARLDAIDKARRAEGVVAKFGWAFCGVFLVAIVAAGITNRTVGSRVLNRTQAASLFDTLRPVTQPAAGTPDRLRFQILQDSPVVTMPANMSYVEGRVGAINGKEAESVLFRDRDGFLALSMVKGMDRVEGLEPATSGDKYSVGLVNGTMCASWRQNGYTLMLMGDRSVDELKALAHRLVPDDQPPARQ